ncbi:MAG: HNH endonuclease [Balneola sp.]|nr:HNH endonuclease [Balneola sp.]
MKLIFLEKAELLHDDPEKKLRTPSDQFDFPSVIRLRRYIRLPYKKVVLTRRNVMRRDSFRCQYCGQKSKLTIDHIHPKSRGGKDTWENLTTACDKCNVKKGNRTPKEANMELLSKPYRPMPITFFRDINGGVQEPWKPYLYMT